MLAATVFGQISAQASVPRLGQDTPLPDSGAAPPFAPQGKAPPVPARPKTRATPAENPGGWFAVEDYPAPARLFAVQGITGFRLYIDEQGGVADCWITDSSGFEMLDRAACDRLRERARFTPARNARRQAVRDIYESRVNWRLPDQELLPWSDAEIHLTLTIDRLGEVQSCFVTTATLPGTDLDGHCPEDMEGLPPMVALAARGYGADEARLVDWDYAIRLDAIRVDEMLRDVPGRVVSGASVWKFGIGPDGHLVECSLTRQKGNPALLTNLCATIMQMRFEPAPQTAGAPAQRTGWAVLVLSYKTGP